MDFEEISSAAPATGDPVDTLLVLFGDQLDIEAPVLTELDPDSDAVLLMEVAEEATHVPSHKQRTVLFLAAMRHFALELAERGWRVRYVRLEDPDNSQSFKGEIGRAVEALEPHRLRFVWPGEWRVFQLVDTWRDELAARGIAVEVIDDAHFYVTPAEFARWAEGRKRLVMEHFYRHVRRRFDVLVTEDGGPVGGEWNYDKENRESLDPAKVELVPPRRFPPDAITRQVMQLVEERFPNAPGRLDSFGWPVTREQAKQALDDFVEHRLARFGPYQDAMVADEPWLFHSLLSPALNLELLDPRHCVAAAEAAYRAGKAPINSVEGFVRQIIGWREYIRGIYWREGPDYRLRNALGAHRPLPDLYWTGRTPMVCLAQSVEQVLEHGYGHHIQRLMITGLFALISGIDPMRVSDWYLGMYVDAVDWVTLPNTLGMTLWADGGLLATKPYAASGNYVNRMSDYCGRCAYDYRDRTGPEACPFTVFYWDFMLQHRDRLARNPRAALAVRNVDRLGQEQVAAIRRRAAELREVAG